jgi:hypothetical protein
LRYFKRAFPLLLWQFIHPIVLLTPKFYSNEFISIYDGAVSAFR